MVAEVVTSSGRLSPIPFNILCEGIITVPMSMGQLEGDKPTKKKKRAVVSPPASPSSSKVQVQVQVQVQQARKKRAYRKSKPSTNHAKRQLPADFQPSSYSVICGRGKECFDSEGNKRFREIINKFLDDYAAAPGKSEKSAIVSKAMNIIRQASPQGAFVKCEKEIWFEVSTRYAREKVGAWFRDCLHNKYKSSSKAKHARKMAKRVSFNALDADEIMNFPLDVEFELPELDNEFYDEVDRREGMVSPDSAKAEEGTTSESTSKTDESVDESADESTGPSDPPASKNKTEAHVSMDPPGDMDALHDSSSGSFYDIDDISLALVPFDAVDDDL